jgi:hypothetical protein
MDRLLLDLLFYTSLLTTLLPLVFIFKDFNRQPEFMKWLAIILILSVTFDFGGRLIYLLSLGNPNVSGNTHVLISTCIMSVFFYKVIKWKSLITPLWIINIIYISFGLTNRMFFQKAEINSYSYIFSSIVIISISLTFFYKLLKELPTQQLHKMPLFWIISGFFFSFAGKLVVYTVTQYLVTYLGDNLIFVWSFHILLTIIANLLIAYGTWLNYKQIPKFTSS